MPKTVSSAQSTRTTSYNKRGMPKNVSTAKITRTTSYKSNVACPKLYPQHRAHAQLLTKPTWGAQKCIHSKDHTHKLLQIQRGMPKTVSSTQSTRTTSYKTNLGCPKMYPQHRAHAQLLTTNVGCSKLNPQHRAHARLLTKPTWHAQNCIHSAKHTHNFLQQSLDAQNCILNTEHTHNFLQNQRGVPKNVSTAQSTEHTLFPSHRARAHTHTHTCHIPILLHSTLPGPCLLCALYLIHYPYLFCSSDGATHQHRCPPTSTPAQQQSRCV